MRRWGKVRGISSSNWALVVLAAVSVVVDGPSSICLRFLGLLLPPPSASLLPSPLVALFFLDANAASTAAWRAPPAVVDDEKLTAHKNLSYVLRKEPHTPEDLAKADELDKLSEALETKIKEGGKEVDEVINRIDTTEAMPTEELEEEEMPPLGDDAEE